MEVDKDEEDLELVRRRTGGRSARVRDAVLQATLEILAEQGPDAIMFSEIGRRSGVHATSIQRRWGSRENVLIEALLSNSEQKVVVLDTGSLREDLIRLARSVSAYITSPLGEGIVRMMAASKDEPGLAANRAKFFQARFETARVILERAATRGELRPETDPNLALELVSGPLYLRLLMTREPIDDAFIINVIDTLMRGLAR